MKKPLVDIRLAFRAEGNFWNAYAAPIDTMEDAVLLGSIALRAIEEDNKFRQAFMDLMKAIVVTFVKNSTGLTIKAFQAERPAPASERGSA